MALALSAGRESGLKRGQARAGDGANADRTMDLLDRLNDVHACKRRPKRRSNPLNCRCGPHHEWLRDRGRIERLTPKDWREVDPMKQVAKLRL